MSYSNKKGFSEVGIEPTTWGDLLFKHKVYNPPLYQLSYSEL